MLVENEFKTGLSTKLVTYLIFHKYAWSNRYSIKYIVKMGKPINWVNDRTKMNQILVLVIGPFIERPVMSSIAALETI